MPVISTNDSKLHKKLKLFLAEIDDLNIGRATEYFIKWGLYLDFYGFSDEKMKKVKEFIETIR